MKGSIKVLKEQPQGSVDGLLNALRQVDVATALAVPVLRHYALSVPANVAVPVSCCACAFFCCCCYDVGVYIAAIATADVSVVVDYFCCCCVIAIAVIVYPW